MLRRCNFLTALATVAVLGLTALEVSQVRADVYVTSFSTDTVMRYDNVGNPLPSAGHTGAVFVDLPSLFPTEARPFHPLGPIVTGGNLYVSILEKDEVLRFSASTGASLNPFIPTGRGGLSQATTLLFQNNNFYVGSHGSNEIKRYDVNGNFLNNFIGAGIGGLMTPSAAIFGPNGSYYVSLQFNNRVLHYDVNGNPLPGTGQTGATFIPSIPRAGGMLVGPDGKFYITSETTGDIRRYDAQTGAFLDVFVPVGSGGLARPSGIVFGPDGDLYVVSTNTNNVKVYDGTTGAFLGDLFAPGTGGVSAPRGITFDNTNPATLITPVAVPEPGNLMLLGLGISGMLGYTLRRRKTA
jgi:WD40 repeat protein